MVPYSVPSSPPTSARRKSPTARGIEYGLWLTALVALGSCLWVWIDARRQQAEGSRTLAESKALPESPVAPGKAPRNAPPYGIAVARIEVARLGLSTVVFEGTGQDVLAHGAGHLRGSALPGESGNVVFAGHRDTFFRPLRDLHEGDVITVTDANSTRRYVVQSTLIVKPNNVGVLAATPSPTLTLITCYPFRFVGSAPERFIARCREVRESQGAPVTVVLPPAPIVPAAAPPRVRLAGLRSKPKVVAAAPAPKPAAPAPAPAPPLTAPNERSADVAADTPAAFQSPAPAVVDVAENPAPANPAAPATPAPKRKWGARWLGKLKGVVHKGSNQE